MNDFIEKAYDLGFGEMQVAQKNGVLELRPINASVLDIYQPEVVLEDYFSNVKEVLLSDSTYPLLDEKTSDEIAKEINAGKLNVGGKMAKRGREISLVSNLFERLPVFDAPMDELLDIRTELSKPLVHFRAEILKLSQSIESSPWDPEFSNDVQGVVQANIEPALAEIEEKLKSTEFASFWSRRIVDKWSYAAGTAMASGYLGATITPVAGILTALAASATFIKAGKTELRNELNEIERNGLYFYYKLKNDRK